MNRMSTSGTKLLWILTALLAIFLLAACSPAITTSRPQPPVVITGTVEATLVSNPGFRYWQPLGWSELPSGQGACGDAEYCLSGPDGAVLSAWMTPLDEGCPQAGSLKECLDQTLPVYEQQFPGYTLIRREEYTTYFGLGGEELEYTHDSGRTHVRELWTHSENLRLRLRFQAPEASFAALDDVIDETFLSVRLNVAN